MRPRGAADGSNDRACRGPKANSSRNADPRQPQNTKTRKLRGKPALETVSSREFFSCLRQRYPPLAPVWHEPYRRDAATFFSLHPSTHTHTRIRARVDMSRDGHLFVSA